MPFRIPSCFNLLIAFLKRTPLALGYKRANQAIMKNTANPFTRSNSFIPSSSGEKTAHPIFHEHLLHHLVIRPEGATWAILRVNPIEQRTVVVRVPIFEDILRLRLVGTKDQVLVPSKIKAQVNIPIGSEGSQQWGCPTLGEVDLAG